MERNDFEKIIQLLQNQTRRKILEILSKEGHYPLQISRSMNTSQQAISKHLKRLEEQGLVTSRESKSRKGGPPTKTYTLNREFSVRIDLGPQLFKTKIEELDDLDDLEGYDDLKNKFDEELENKTLEKQRKLVQEIEKEIDDLENKRKCLLKMKEKALSKAFNYIHNEFDDYEVREILYYVLDSGVTDPDKIARHFNVREDEIERIIDKIKEKDKIDIW
ncbi:MAG: ArsR/SmtB family transcription factor [Thermoplasmatota archaeon]